MKTHVHVYHVMSKAEVDVNTKDKKDAASLALCHATSGKAKFRKSDCKFITIIPEAEAKPKPKKLLVSGSRKYGTKRSPSTTKPNIKPVGQTAKRRKE